MATGLRSSRASTIGVAALLAVLTIAIATGCGPSASGPRPEAPQAPRQTPRASLSAEMAATSSLLTDALVPDGIRLDVPVSSVQPAEPATLSSAPRVLLQADVHDADGGYVLIYQLADAATASLRGAEFADYLESGPGQVNFPIDTQFSLALVGSTLIFTWWSAERASDRELAERVFDAMAGVGQAIPIVK
jgi:hypothetical protein